jgi:HD-like signal output (HDOD) protein
LPTLYEELLGMLESPDSSAERVASVISKDAGMVASPLRVANSAYYNFRQPLASVTQAVALLDIENVKSLVLGCKVYQQVKKTGTSGSPVDEVWRHGFAVATHARAIASLADIGGVGIESAFLAGLLHDVGRIVLQTNLPREYETVRGRAREHHISLSDAEQQVFGATHAQLSAHLLGLWGLRDTIVEAVGFHHQPALCPVKGFSILAAVYVADALDHEQHPGAVHDSLLDQGYLAQAGLEALLPQWRAAQAA